MQNEEKIISLLEGLVKDVTSFKTDVASLKADVSDLNDRLLMVEGRLTSVENDTHHIHIVQADVKDIKKNMQALVRWTSLDLASDKQRKQVGI